jgi:hypothetical protein
MIIMSRRAKGITVNRIAKAAIVPLAIVAGACAPRIYEASGSMAPKLVGCAGFQPGANRTVRSDNYSVSVLVDRNGNVVPGSGQVGHQRRRVGTTGGAAAARSMAESCTFRPARQGGTKVEARTSVGVAIPVLENAYGNAIVGS